MLHSFRIYIVVFSALVGLATSWSVLAQNSDAPEVFDRLDGTGLSKKKVDVIEWDGNLEVHVYPKGSLKGISAKIDDRTQGKKIMVVGYRFEGMKTPLIRRAILGVPFKNNLQAFIDPTPSDYDKIAITNTPLKKPWVPYKLDPAPAQWFPDGDPRNQSEEAPKVPQKLTQPNVESNRAPASQTNPVSVDDDQAIPHFSW